MKRIGLLVTVLSVTVLASSARAQDTTSPNLLVAGAKSLSFAIPGGNNGYASGAAGLWYMITDQVNLGFNVGLGLDRQNAGTGTETTWDILLAPAMRYYLKTDGVVAPFIHGQANFRINHQPDNTGEELGVAGGVGAEWFPVRQFSIAGQVGLGVDVVRQNNSEPAIGTFTSQLSAQLYWD
ncbi:MAG: hypothetical protein H7Z43_05175 [Clostridia bacterium]|nr:hypothetical protein [Deltaproteobacteria bacterium]